MGLAAVVLRRAGRKAWTRMLARAGTLVARWVDTSADAPEHRSQPKRDLYAHLDRSDPPGAPRT